MQEIAEENADGKQGQLQRQQSAVQKATRVLLNRHTAPASLVLTYLPWLISASPKHALSVLKVSCSVVLVKVVLLVAQRFKASMINLCNLHLRIFTCCSQCPSLCNGALQVFLVLVVQETCSW